MHCRLVHKLRKRGGGKDAGRHNNDGREARTNELFQSHIKSGPNQGCHTSKDAEFYAESNGTLYIAIRPGMVEKHAKNRK